MTHQSCTSGKAGGLKGEPLKADILCLQRDITLNASLLIYRIKVPKGIRVKLRSHYFLKLPPTSPALMGGGLRLFLLKNV